MSEKHRFRTRGERIRDYRGRIRSPDFADGVNGRVFDIGDVIQFLYPPSSGAPEKIVRFDDPEQTLPADDARIAASGRQIDKEPDMNYVSWALLGMAAYSATTLFVKLATRGHVIPVFNVLAVSVLVVSTSVWAITLSAGMWNRQIVTSFRSTDGLWTLAAGVALAIAVSSLFRALSLGPASIVVPIYGMFIVGGSVLGVIVLGEAVTPAKAIGLALAVSGVLLIAR